MTSTHYVEHPSPIGPLRIAATPDGLVALYMQGQRHRSDDVDPTWRLGSTPLLDETRRQLDDYFNGRRTTFSLPLAAVGTPFQRDVWAALVGIGYGSTVSYAELARRIGRPSAVRAVGLANGRNPVSIVVPCHRVIGADGSMTGYGGGLERKVWLLALEARSRAADASLSPKQGTLV